MKIHIQVVAAIAIAITTVACAAQPRLDGGLQTISEPIALSYRKIETADASGQFAVTFLKDGETVRKIDQRFDGAMSAQDVGDDLEISLTKTRARFYDDAYTTSKDEVTCLMSKMGQIKQCDGPANLGYPLFEQESYKSGDKLILPFGNINGVSITPTGDVKGRTTVGGRPVVFITWAESRQQQVAQRNVDFEMTGHAYLDIATGHPLQMEVTGSISGPFEGFDLVRFFIQYDVQLADNGAAT